MINSPSNWKQPAEWEKHEAIWLAWPWDGSLWQDNLSKAQDEFSDLCKALALEGALPEKLRVLVPNSDVLKEASARLSHLDIEWFEMPYGDIWLRDTAPIFVRGSKGEVQPSVFQFNGWGEKYLLDGDSEVASRIAKLSVSDPNQVRFFSFVLEGGSVDIDGAGTALTTEQCLLNPNRNPQLSRNEMERVLSESLGVSKVIWLKEGLINDHTDGHIDTLARFIAPGKVVCMRPSGEDDPNARVLLEIIEALKASTDVNGEPLEVFTVTSPGAVYSEDSEDLENLMPASYMNFLIANSVVVVPIYGAPQDRQALEELTALFPNKKVIGLPAKAILTGGGAFHCITQQQPAVGIASTQGDKETK